MSMPDVKLVVFDWAGTTVDFGCLAPVGAFVAVFAERGVTVPVAEARGPMGLHKKDHIRVLLQGPAGERWRQAVGRDWTEADVEELYRQVTPMQVAAARLHAELCPGVLECVAELRRHGVKIAATTGYFREAADVCYTAAAEQGYVPDFVICADEVPAGRPAPWMLFRCMEALGVYPPAAVVAVGDTPADMQAAKNAGCIAFGVTTSGNEVGLSEVEFAALTEAERQAVVLTACRRLMHAGADSLVSSIGQVPMVLRSAGMLP